MRLIALESHRHRAIVIGEDLGTVPAGFRDRLGRAGIYGMHVLWFERERNRFAPPQAWPTGCAMTSTHDLPTVAGWWRGTDIDVRAQCGLVEDADKERATRTTDRQLLWRACAGRRPAEGDLPAPDETSRVVDAAVSFIAQTPSPLALLPLEDARPWRSSPTCPAPSTSIRIGDAAMPGKRRSCSPRGRTPASRSAGATRTSMSAPRATMRLQFHRGFTFADAEALVPYFAALGISHLYASPIMTARPGSTHGYDSIDPTRVNPELGGEEGLRRLVAELRRHELGLIVDIVPNHMAVASGNAWWIDVLAHGRDSRYARYFDIDWEPDDPHLRGKVLLPVLGRPYEEALAAGEIALRGDNAGDAFIRYFDHVFPLAAGALALCERFVCRSDPASSARTHAIASTARTAALSPGLVAHRE